MYLNVENCGSIMYHHHKMAEHGRFHEKRATFGILGRTKNYLNILKCFVLEDCPIKNSQKLATLNLKMSPDSY